jgi:hypothetical protein
VFRFTAVAIAAILLAGCSQPQSEARERLGKVDTKQLRLDAARLYNQLHAGPGPEFVALKPARWPESFKKLQPIRVGCYGDGFAFVFSGTQGSESGIHVQPTGMDKVPHGTHLRYERLEEGVYWFQPAL